MMMVVSSSSDDSDDNFNGTPPVNGQALETAKALRKHLMETNKFTSAGASGALAVAQRESGFNVQAINPAGGVAGLFQWSGWGNFVNGNRIHSEGSIKGQDLPTLTLENQFKLIDHELKGSFSTVQEKLSKATDPVQGAKDWSLIYEGVSLDDGQTNLAMITQLAQQWEAYFNSGGGGSGNISSLEKLLGTTVGSGQCYALSSFYVESISGFRLHGLNAYQIGSDNEADFKSHGWKVIFNPKANDLKVGQVINWGSGPVAGDSSVNPYGHTGVIASVKGNSFTTYEQNVGVVQIVQKENRTYDSSITSVCEPPSK